MAIRKSTAKKTAKTSAKKAVKTTAKTPVRKAAKKAVKAAAKASGPAVYDLHVELLDVDPSIWRRVLVPADMTLEDLHDVLQWTLGWTDSHLHSFEVNGESYGPHGPEFGELDMLDEGEHTLGDLLGGRSGRFRYEYDFGDSWQHLIKAKPVAQPDPKLQYPVCVEGARSAPPEDCGGTPGYEDLLAAIRDPKHPQHEDMLEWVGGEFDPEAFDLNGVNRVLRKHFK